MSDELKLPISEIFGPTIQGEGSLTGNPTVFVRMGGCDYRCTWCDSLYAVLPEYADKWNRMTCKEIFAEVKKLSPVPILVTLSGGNPAMLDFTELLELGHAEGYTFCIETQGSINQPWINDLDFITISPKPPSSLMKTDYDKLTIFIDDIEDHSKISLKIVVSDKKDYQYAKEIFDRYPHIKAYITPCNITPSGDFDLDALVDKTKYVVDLALADGFHRVSIIPQLHTIIWGNERGV